MQTPDAPTLLDVVQACLHTRRSEWVFLRELRVGTGLRRNAGQRLDAFALNCLAHTAMKRICYEVKVSRADFLCEIKKPVKRRVGLRYSNEFYFVTPVALLETREIPIECGLIEVGHFESEDRSITAQHEIQVHFDAAKGVYCRVAVPAPWRDTPGPTWEFVASMLKNHQRCLEADSPKFPKQQRLELQASEADAR